MNQLINYNNLLCLLDFALVERGVLHLAAALNTPSDESHIFDLITRPLCFLTLVMTIM